jgi:hypothetical protein
MKVQPNKRISSELAMPLDVGTMRRRERVADFLIRGEVSIPKIAAALDSPYLVIQNDIDAIYNEWITSSKQDPNDCRIKRINQLNWAAQKASQSYERSRKDQEEITTTYSMRECPDCKGSGFIKDTKKWCKTCEGEGEVKAEVVTKRVKGNPGETKHLDTYMKCVLEAARLEGCYLFEKALEKAPQTTNNTLLISGSPEKVAEEIKRLPVDMLLEAKELLTKMKPVMQRINQETMDRDGIIDTVAVPVETK